VAVDNLNVTMTEAEMERAIARIMDRLDEVNTFYIKKIAGQIKRIGEMSQSSVNRLVVMADMGADVAEITERLRVATGLNVRDLYAVYNQALNDVYTDKRFAIYLEKNPMQPGSVERLNQYARLVSVQTAQSMVNLSNTTAVSSAYREAIDKAIYAVSSGVGDYKSVMRQTVQSLGYNGMQVKYGSGYHRRLDSAVRQNIIDGANQLAQNASLLMGEELGFDAVELSAHARSAPDHEPVQGRVFLKSEFEKMQSGSDFYDVDGNHYPGFKRQIGEWNCMHIAMSFSTQHSVRRYADDQLSEWRAANAAGCTIGGKHYSTYEAVQLMRRIETEVRRQKDAAVAAAAAGDKELRQKCQLKIDALAKSYTQIAQTAGITPRRDRMSVNGFRAIKVS
jgi:hypothetical protein